MRFGYSILALMLLSVPAGAAEPRPLLDLMNRVPDPPSSAAEAVKWFDQGGKLIHPGLLALKADIEANRRPGQTVASQDGAAAVATVTQGMENVGVDPVRMQKDPAYAKEVQARIQRMSPQEQMAFMQKMMQPHNQAAIKEVKAMAQESPAVQAAVDAAKQWPELQRTRSAAHIALLRETEQTVDRASQKSFGLVRPRIEYDSIGCDNPCLAQWKAYGEKLWPLVLNREAEVHQTRREGLQRDRAALTGLLKEADGHLTATNFGRAAQSQTDRTYLVGYHEGLLGEIDRLIDETETAARRAADVVNAGVERMFWGTTSRGR